MATGASEAGRLSVQGLALECVERGRSVRSYGGTVKRDSS
jgi:hypothetical protein